MNFLFINDRIAYHNQWLTTSQKLKALSIRR